MAVHKTKRNMVCAYEPEPHDSFVETYLNGPEHRRLLLTQTIDQYQATVDWAVSIADQMAWPLEVVTFTAAEYVQRRREQIERGLGAMTDQERGALRQHIVRAVAEVIRDCDNADVRAGAYEVLKKVRVV